MLRNLVCNGHVKQRTPKDLGTLFQTSCRSLVCLGLQAYIPHYGRHLNFSGLRVRQVCVKQLLDLFLEPVLENWEHVLAHVPPGPARYE